MPFDLLKIFSGTVEITAEGAECENIINYCVKNGIDIKNPKKSGYKLILTVSAKDYKKLRKPAKKAGIKLRVNKKKGLYFFTKKQIGKAGLLFGTIIAISFILIMNIFIWDIKVIGTNESESEEIITVAEKFGLKKGTLSLKHEPHIIEWGIMQKIDGFSTVEVNIQGSRATIVVNKAKEEAEMKSDDDIPINIVAGKYGIIRKINVFDGQKKVSVGDAVMKGELLVSAVYEDRHNKLTLKHAKAEIIAETDYSLEIKFPLKQKIKRKGNLKKTVYEFDVLGQKIIIGNKNRSDKYISEKTEKDLYFFWIKLPITLIKTSYFDVKLDTITYNFEQGKAGAFKLLDEKEKNEMRDIEIKSRIIEEKVKNNNYIIKADYICLMDIATEQPIESNIPWENTDDMS